MTKTKDQLSAILSRAKLNAKERDIFESMWDGLRRYGKVSPKQRAWVERVYFGQRLDRAVAPTKPPTTQNTNKSGPFMGTKAAASKSKVGYINYVGVSGPLLVTNMESLHQLCPLIRQGSLQYKKIQRFFSNGGEVLKIKPPEAA